MKLRLHGVELELLPERAVWWPARKLLIVADVHLGKDQVFRRHGVSIPDGVLHHELDALDALLANYAAEKLLVLGDWVHAPPAEGDAWPEIVLRWRKRHAQLSIDLVLGNHDRSLSGWLQRWKIDCIGASFMLDGLMLVHAVDAEKETLPAGLSGHWHPAARLRSGREKLRLPAFALRDQHLILPSFGRFTGGMDGLDRYGWQLLAAAGQRVVAVS